MQSTLSGLHFSIKNYNFRLNHKKKYAQGKTNDVDVVSKLSKKFWFQIEKCNPNVLGSCKINLIIPGGQSELLAIIYIKGLILFDSHYPKLY